MQGEMALYCEALGEDAGGVNLEDTATPRTAFALQTQDPADHPNGLAVDEGPPLAAQDL